MKSYDERIESIFRKYDEKLAEKKRRAAVIRRSLISSGACAATIAGIWLISGNDLKGAVEPDRSDVLIAETTAPAVTTAPEEEEAVPAETTPAPVKEAQTTAPVTEKTVQVATAAVTAVQESSPSAASVPPSAPAVQTAAVNTAPTQVRTTAAPEAPAPVRTEPANTDPPGEAPETTLIRADIIFENFPTIQNGGFLVKFDKDWEPVLDGSDQPIYTTDDCATQTADGLVVQRSARDPHTYGIAFIMPKNSNCNGKFISLFFNKTGSYDPAEPAIDISFENGSEIRDDNGTTIVSGDDPSTGISAEIVQVSEYPSEEGEADAAAIRSENEEVTASPEPDPQER
ncbi:MAG: hypothetical protein IJ071_08235 [Ruminococcus sp.]|nr:hypothetical protein [Ruminococcus sp.]